MRGGGILGVIVLVWLLIGVVAAYQTGLLQDRRKQLRYGGNHRVNGRSRAVELRGREPEGGGLQRQTA